MKIINYFFPPQEQITANEVIQPDSSALEDIRTAFKEGNFTQLIDLFKVTPPSPEIRFYQAVMLENNLNDTNPFIEKLSEILDEDFFTKEIIENAIKTAFGGDKNYQNTIIRKLSKDIKEFTENKDLQDEDKEIFLNKVAKLQSKEAAKHLYQESYKGGFLQAGNSLAKIYEKEGKQVEAVEIYTAIMSNSKDDKTAKSYAAYRLLRIEESKILHHQTKELTFPTKTVISSYEDINKGNPELNDTLKKKILYHTALLKIEQFIENEKAEILKWYDNELSKINAAKTDPERKQGFRNFLKTDLEKKLKETYKLSDISELEEAKRLLQESSALGYKPAEAELINIEARELLAQGKYQEAIIKCNEESLYAHAKNINARLISAEAYEKLANQNWDNEKYDAALDLTKEVLARDPENQTALEQKKRLVEKATEEITKRITEILLDKTKEFIPQYSVFSGPKQARIDKIKQTSDAYIKSLSNNIKSSLMKQEYLQGSINFSNINKISSDISEVIFHDNHSNFKRIIENTAEETKPEASKRTEQSINHYCNLQAKEFKTELKQEDQDLVKNRAKFKESIVNQLAKHHARCAALTVPGSDLQVRLNTAGFDYATQLASPLAGFLGPNNGGIAVGIGGLALKVVKDIGERWYRQGLYDTAKKFASIGEVDNKRDANHSSNAKEAFEYVAEELVRSYGIQIDNLDGEKAIEALATTATEKMLNHLSDNTSTMKKYRQFAQNPFASVISNISTNLSNLKQDTQDYIAEMLEGVIKGKPQDGEKIIATKDAAQWKASEIFEKPAITIDGENVYCNSNSDAKTYGARYSEFVPNNYEKTVIDSSTKHRIEERLQKHLYLVERSDTRTPEEKRKRHAKREEITRAQYTKDRRKARISFVASLTELAAGAASAYTAALYGLTAGLGFHPGIIAVASHALGISSALLPPIIIGTLAVVGVGLLVKGTVNLVKASDQLDLLDKKHILTAEEANAKMTKKAHIKENAEHKAEVSEKIKSKARYVTSDIPKTNDKLSDKDTTLANSVLNRWRKKVQNSSLPPTRGSISGP